MSRIDEWPQSKLVKTILEFQEGQAMNLPRKENFPRLPNIDYFAFIEPYDSCIGGDHLAFVNFNKYNLEDMISKASKRKSPQETEKYAAKLNENRNKIGILIADSKGHGLPSSVPITFLHGSFMTGIEYELEHNAEVSANFISKLAKVMNNWLTPEFMDDKPFITLLYGEIDNNGKFRYVLLGHPPPMVYSREFDRIVTLPSDSMMTSTPLGIVPRKKTRTDDESNSSFLVNEIKLLGQGDILLLYTDGLTEQKNGELNFARQKTESILRDVKDRNAKDIYNALRSGLQEFYPPSDDLTMAIFKKN